MSGGRTKTEKRNMKISEARPLLEEAESDRLINQDTVSSLHVQQQCCILTPFALPVSVLSFLYLSLCRSVVPLIRLHVYH